MKGIIKYRYCENKNKEFIDINNLTKDSNNEEYFCIGCNQKLVPRLGSKNTHHFAHKNDTIYCSEETYLHKLAKQVFYETYLSCKENKEPFYIFGSLFNQISLSCKYTSNINSENCMNKKVQ